LLGKIKPLKCWHVAVAPHLAFAGLQAYHGSAQHLRGWEERRQAITQAADKAGRTRDLLARDGIDCPVVTGAGTGTFEFETASGVYTELQCGSYIFMDADYGRNLARDGGRTKAFDPSLFVCATVMNRPDRGPRDRRRRPEGPRHRLRPAARLRRARRDLRARLRRARPARHLGRHQPPRARRQNPPRPDHCDPTVNLYNWYVGISGNRVEQL
jgi:3-hydroxy-D-aspartate aldolase